MAQVYCSGCKAIPSHACCGEGGGLGGEEGDRRNKGGGEKRKMGKRPRDGEKVVVVVEVVR